MAAVLRSTSTGRPYTGTPVAASTAVAPTGVAAPVHPAYDALLEPPTLVVTDTLRFADVANVTGTLTVAVCPLLPVTVAVTDVAVVTVAGQVTSVCSAVGSLR